MTPSPAEKPPLTCDNRANRTARNLRLTDPGLADQHLERVIDVSTSVPLPAPSAQRPAKTFAERMARVDGCPSCVINYAVPSIVRDTLEGFVAHYTCTDCGHDWFTSWED